MGKPGFHNNTSVAIRYINELIRIHFNSRMKNIFCNYNDSKFIQLL